MPATISAPSIQPCSGCGIDIAPKTYRGNPKKWCSESCRIWTHRHPGQVRNRNCIRCGGALKGAQQKWCSLTCDQIARGNRRAEPRCRPDCQHPGCTKRAKCKKLCKTHYNRAYHPGSQRKWPGRVEVRRASWRLRNHLRRSALRSGDVTAAYELALRKATATCPLCAVRLVEEPYLPASKELDHIVPLHIGGTHTMGNVRIICRGCNGRRPIDGSDLPARVVA